VILPQIQQPNLSRNQLVVPLQLSPQEEQGMFGVIDAREGHMQCDCANKHVLVVKADGGYSSASDFDDDTHALLAADDTGRDKPSEEQIGAEDVEHYESHCATCA
jgi:hypothetical protein